MLRSFRQMLSLALAMGVVVGGLGMTMMEAHAGKGGSGNRSGLSGTDLGSGR